MRPASASIRSSRLLSRCRPLSLRTAIVASLATLRRSTSRCAIGTRRARHTRRVSRESRRLRRMPHRRQERRALRGRAGDELAVRHDRQQQHHARQAPRHRQLQLRRFRACVARRRGAGRQAALSGDALPRVRQDHRRRHARALRLHDAGRAAGRSMPPPTRVPFPFNQRWALAAWDWFFAPSGAYKPRADRDAAWNRGAYLVQSLGHCGSCHTPRGAGYQERGYDESSKHYLAGGINDNWYAPEPARRSRLGSRARRAGTKSRRFSRRGMAAAW